MPYIRADGTIVRGNAPPPRPWAVPAWAKAALCVAACVLFMLVDSDSTGTRLARPKDDLADGHIPASDRSDHWAFLLANRMNFVRDYTRHADKGSLLNLPSFNDFVESAGARTADVGGEERHAPEEIDLLGTAREMAESVAVTRCTATNYAITAYFCGSEAADNMDSGKWRPGTVFGGGLRAFEGLLDRQEAQRLVLRFGLGSGEAKIDHVWMIIGEADGSFVWLQSYIDEYSLGTWMELANSTGVNPMSLSGLRRRVELLKILAQAKDGWDEEADDAYFELFNVRVNDRQERHNARGAPRWDKATWKGGDVHFNVACQWPLETLDRAASSKEKGKEKGKVQQTRRGKG